MSRALSLPKSKFVSKPVISFTFELNLDRNVDRYEQKEKVGISLDF